VSHSTVMKAAVTRFTVASLALVALGNGNGSAKTGEERWIAYSRTAMAITGDIVLSPTRLRAAGVDIPLKVAADLPRFRSYDGSQVGARILAVGSSKDFKLLNGNRFGCGKPIRWIAVWREDGGKRLAMATFENKGMPTGYSSPGFCASYHYVKP
jgi:hypothetical protein